MTDIARLGIEVDTSQIARADRKLDQLGGSAGVAARKTKRATDGMASGYSNASKAIALAKVALISFIAATASAVLAVRRFISGTSEAEAAQAQLAAAILSTGGAANRSRNQLNAFASELQSVTNFGDEAINAMQGVLLTFTQIEGATFDRATSAILDLSTAMGTDLKSSALQVGKALNDPILGMTALSRSGIQFTETQKEAVKAMVATNDIAGAQALILGELETQFGGSAAAARDTLGGALTSLGNAWGDLFELSGPATESLKKSVDGLVSAVSDPRFVSAVSSIGAALFGMLEIGISAMTGLSSGVAFLAGNIDAVSGIAIASAAALTVSFAPAITAAAVATGAWVVNLIALKAALISTGIGAVVVGVGLVIGKLISARRQTENWGNSFKMIALQVKAASLNMKAGFISALGSMAYEFVEFTWTVADGLNALFGSDLMGVSGVVTQKMNQSFLATEAAANAATAAANALRLEIGEVSDESEDATGVFNDMAEAVGAGGVVGAISDAEEATANFDSTMSDAVKTMDEMGVSKAEILIGGINSVSDAFGNWISNGLGDFKGFATSIIDTFKGMLAQMIAMALKNRILLSLGFGGSALPAAAGAATSGATGAASGALGTIGSGLMSGASGVVSGLFSGGLSGGATALTTALSGATTGLSGMATAIGAIALPVAAAVAAFSFFRTKTKKLDSGLRLTAQGMDLAVASFEKVKKTRFFGLSSRTSTNYSQAGGSLADPIAQAFGEMTDAVAKSAAVLGISSKAFRGFSAELNLSLEGLSDEQAQAAVIQGLTDMGNQFAGMAGNLGNLAREGEDAMTTIARLGNELQTVNGVMATLGFQSYEMSVAGAAAASGLADMYGGIQNLTAATQSYYSTFYTTEEQLSLLTQNLTASFADLGVALPKTREAFRALVDGTVQTISDATARADAIQNLLTADGIADNLEDAATLVSRVYARNAAKREALDATLLQASLVSLSGSFDQMISASDALALETESATAAIDDNRAAQAAADATLRERLGIQREIWRLMGDESSLRADELSQLDASNRALQERLWSLQDEKAAQATADAAAESAAEAAASAASEIADAARAAEELAAGLAESISKERLSIQREIWRLMGDESSLRADDLSQLDVSNRSLQERLWTLQDEAEATEAATRAIEDLVQSLSPENFGQALDYNLALGRASQGIAGVTATGVPLSVVPNSNAANDSLVDEIKNLKAELVNFKDESRGLNMNANADIRKIRLNSDRDQAIGTPAVRTS